jgi:hypothetical protein
MFTIQRAVRKGTPALIGLWGASGSGKTYSALHVARGLVGPAGKIGLIDTENRRAEFYADLVGGWDHLDLQPPFTPERYTAAFDEFERAGGYGCVIVDSTSHVWQGEGGVLDLADKSNYVGLKKWQAPKMAYSRMVNTLLRAPFHVIFCLRAKDGVRQIGGGRDAKIESIGAQPICGKGFLYEMTVAALLGPDHKPSFPGPHQTVACDPLIPAIKAPEDLSDVIKPGAYLGIETGERIAQWVSGAAAFDAERAKLERVARDVATMGMEKYRLHWESLTNDQKRALLPLKEELKAIAEEADRAAEADAQADETEQLPL